MKKFFLLVSILFGSTQFTSAQVLHYDRTTNPGWFGTTPWSSTGTSGPFNATWTDGNTANFGSGAGTDVTLSDSASVAGLTNAGSLVTLLGSAPIQTLTFSGGTINGNFAFSTRLTLTGDLEQTGGAVNLVGATYSAYSGMYRVSGGTTTIGQSTRVSSSSNFTVAGGNLQLQVNTATPSIGSLTVNSGVLRVGRSTGTFGFNLSASSLSGTGGSIVNQGNSSAAENTLTIDQAGNTEYQGAINGTANGGLDRLSLVKAGIGNLTLSGTISNMVRTTNVSGGRLYLSGISQTFGDDLIGSTAIQVNSGGMLGGTGTVTTMAGDNVVVASGGILAAGLDGTAGRTTYALGSGASLDITGIATGALRFDLGSDGTAGGTYDQIQLNSGSLAIGSGLLNFNDFGFTALSGFGVGTYTLFNLTGTSTLSGTLGSSLTGTIAGFDGTLSRSADNIVLNVVPEPSTTAFFLLGACALGWVQMARRSRAVK